MCRITVKIFLTVEPLITTKTRQHTWYMWYDKDKCEFTKVTGELWGVFDVREFWEILSWYNEAAQHLNFKSLNDHFWTLIWWGSLNRSFMNIYLTRVTEHRKYLDPHTLLPSQVWSQSDELFMVMCRYWKFQIWTNEQLNVWMNEWMKDCMNGQNHSYVPPPIPLQLCWWGPTISTNHIW